MSYLAIQSVGRKIIAAFTSFELLEERLAAFKGLEEKNLLSMDRKMQLENWFSSLG